MAWSDDVVSLLTAAGVGDFGLSIFVGRKAAIPMLPSGLATVQILSESGASPENTQNATVTPAYVRPSAVLITRADNRVAAEAKARACYAATFKRNTTINTVWYREISPVNEVHEIDLDDTKQVRYSFTITAVRRY